MCYKYLQTSQQKGMMPILINEKEKCQVQWLSEMLASIEKVE